MATLIDLTDPTLDIDPIPQSADVELCTLTFAEPIAEDDVLEMQVRDSIGGQIIGTLKSKSKAVESCFVLNVTTRKVTIRPTEEETRKWFKDQPVTEEDRVRVLTGTLLHKTKGGSSRSWSGELDVRFAIELSFTRS